MLENNPIDRHQLSRQQDAPVAIGPSARITVTEIAQRLSIGRLAVYALLEKGEIPSIRLGRRWIITRFAYDDWEHRCGQNAVRSNHGHPQAQV